MLFLLAVVKCGRVDAAETAPGPRFSRHVVALFSRLGCNAGSCHGAVKGQNGFRLTLFGAEPALDHDRLLREFCGRRINLSNPDGSLLLLKATGRVPHEGGRRLVPDGPEYRLIRDWIAAGATLDPPEKSRTVRLSVTPPSRTVRVGDGYALRVEAVFADDSAEDVTALCTFEARDKTIVAVDAAGRVTARGVGDTAVVARYRGQPAVASVLVPGDARGAFPEVNPHNFIDRHILDKLRRLHVPPSDLCDDATFLRRACLDVTGTLPTSEEVRDFLADTRVDRRARKIEELLARPGHAALWATRFCDILRPSGFDARFGFSEAAEARRFYAWVRAHVQENTPYDQLAERILLATSRDGRTEEAWVSEIRAIAEENAGQGHELPAYAGRKTLDLYWQRNNATGVKGALQVAHAFLGLRLECAQCHRHPHDVWRQDDLLSFANFFMTVNSPGGNGSSPAVAKSGDALLQQVKDLRAEAKKLTDQAKDKSLAKGEAEKFQARATALTNKAQGLENAAKRLKSAEVHTAAKGGFASVTSPLGKQESRQYRLLGAGQTVEVPAGQDPREQVVAWLRRPDNPYFAPAIVNRVWAHYFGRGIIDPPDQLSPLNPPTHPELLAELSADFINHGYDLKHLHRTILNSRTYQQSARTNASNRTDTANYGSFYLRRLPAEVLVDALNQATGGHETYPAVLHLPPGARAVEVAGPTGTGRDTASLQYPFLIYGRPARDAAVACDCERDGSTTVVQTLFLANHPRVREKIASAKGRVAEIARTIPDNKKRIEEVFLGTVSRLPSPEELQTCLDYLKGSSSEQKGLEDVLWGLLNTREFILNH
jgi:hypothetical protein